jgi:hypothetical protein
MKYKGIEIGTPTIKMVEEYISRERFGFHPQIAYDHLKKELWQTKKGQPFQSLEAALNAYNGAFVLRQRKNSGFVDSLF